MHRHLLCLTFRTADYEHFSRIARAAGTSPAGMLKKALDDYGHFLQCTSDPVGRRQRPGMVNELFVDQLATPRTPGMMIVVAVSMSAGAFDALNLLAKRQNAEPLDIINNALEFSCSPPVFH